MAVFTLPSQFDPLTLVIANRLVDAKAIESVEATPGPFLQFLMDLLKQLLPMLVTCIPVVATPENVHAALNSLTIWQKIKLLRTVRSHLALQSAINRYAIPVYREVLAALPTVTVEHVKGCLDELATSETE